MPVAKDWWLSKTVWWNVASALVVIGGIVVDPAMGLDPRIVAVATAVVTVGNLVIRAFTNTAIAGTPAASSPPHG